MKTVENGRIGESYSERALNNNREMVLNSYNNERLHNEDEFMKNNIKYSKEYIYDNQKEDAIVITEKFYNEGVRAISIVKRTKVGMDGLAIEIAKNMSTHPDDNFVLLSNNVIMLTGMSNVSWERGMKSKIPEKFRNNIYHHGQLQNVALQLKNINNALIIVDEIDTGGQEEQKLHKLLKDSGLLDISYMEKFNIRFVFVSATMVNELRELFKWGDKHYTYYMTIPNDYIGHKDFVKMNIIQEFYDINNKETADKWVETDILQHYGTDFRVHIIRTDNKRVQYIQDSCIRKNICFKNHTSVDRICEEDLQTIFENIVKTNHVVIAIKGFFRRADLIPNNWKKKIGCTMEKFVKKCDTNVQVQGLPGRMSGYWRSDIENGHITGPHRTSLYAMKEYEKFYENPTGFNNYKTAGKTSFVASKNIKNLSITCDTEHNKRSCMRIPIILSIGDMMQTFLKIDGKKNRKEFIVNIIKEKEISLYEFVTKNGVKCTQITEPQEDNSYKKHITDVVNKSIIKLPYTVDLKKDDKDYNNWQVFVDNREKRLCIVLWVIDESFYTKS